MKMVKTDLSLTLLSNKHIIIILHYDNICLLITFALNIL